jgi:hypothetical protein
MGRSLPPNPNLDHLKRKAKRVLRAVRAGTAHEVTLLRQVSKYAKASEAEIRDSVTLLEVQHALALDYGYSGWAALKADVESRTPALQSLRPVLRIGSFEQAVEHYVGWLGFNLDWDWREAPGQPVIAALSRDDAAFMVNEYPQTPGPIELHLTVKNFNALLDEWNAKRPGSAEPRIAPPYEFPDIPIRDPWDNVLVFEGQDEALERRRREAVRPKMREYVQAELDAGRGFPTPEELRDAIGPPLGTAIEVLNEFPAYGPVFEARLEAARKPE